MATKAMASALALLFLMAVPAAAQDQPQGPPSAWIAVRQLQVAFIGSAALGAGTVTYEGQSYPIRVTGLGVGGVGVSRLTAWGEVYGLRRLQDVEGVYVELRRGWALGQQGQGAMWLANAKGVSIKLTARRRGVQLTLGADGVVIALQ